MKNKGSAILVISIVFIILIIGIIIVVIVLNQGSKQKENILIARNISLYLRARDSKANSFISSNYLISDSKVLRGNLINSAYTLIGDFSDKNILILCSKEGYYSNFINKTFSSSEINQNISKLTCNLNQIGSLTIRNTGDLQENGKSTITLNINSQGIFKYLGICLGWTSGISEVKMSNSSIKEAEIPKRLNGKADRCYEMDTILKDNQINYNFIVKTNNLSPLDTLTFYIYDKDWNFKNGKFTMESESNKLNLGSRQDIIYKISNPYV